MGKKSTFQCEVAVRMKPNLETLTLILNLQSPVFFDINEIKARVSAPTFRTVFMVRVSFRVIRDCDVIFNMSTAVRIKLQTEKCFFIHPLLVRHSVFISYFDVITYIKMNNLYN